MALSFTPLHPTFAAEVSPVDLRQVHDDVTLEAIRGGMDQYAVLVFRNQPFTDDEQLAFAKRLDGELHAKTGARALGKTRLASEALADISNVGGDGNILPAEDRKRLYGLGNRLWHTDASFVDPPGRYSMLSTRVLPDGGGPDTQFADTRSAWDALDDATRESLIGLEVQHSIAHSRRTLGFEFTPEEDEELKGAIHPLVREFPSGRKSIYVASHAARILGWTLPEGRLMLKELLEHATQPRFVYTHAWRDGDLVIWDNRATMHRARPFSDTVERRELRRVTTLDLPRKGSAAA
jgi:alpha-ketoglutarate-dependent 2,4-dichlorophenoxyacetate dioxygenase